LTKQGKSYERNGEGRRWLFISGRYLAADRFEKARVMGFSIVEGR